MPQAPSPPPAPVLSSATPTAWPILLRWILLTATLAAEILFLSISFDTAAFEHGDSRWSQFANNSPVFIRIGFAALAAFLLILYPRLGGIAAEGLGAAKAQGPRWLGWLLLHGAAFATFFHLTEAMFGAAATGAYPPESGVAQWLSAATAMLALWSLAAAPFGFWVRLAVREWLAVLGAIAAGAAAWGLGELTREFWHPLAAGTFWLAKNLLGLVYKRVLYDETDHALGTPHFIVNIAPECSGYEGIGLIAAFLILYLWLFRERMRFPHALLLFPLGALTIWLANALRIAALIILGTSYSSEVALGGFHSQAGWITFAAIALGLIALTERFRLLTKDAPEAAPSAEQDNAMASALLVPLLVLMASVMLTSALSSGFDWLYPLRPILTGAALWRYRKVYRQWDWRWSRSSVAIGVGVFAVWLGLEPESTHAPLQTALAGLPSGTERAWLAFRIVGSALLVPVAEELAFRGYLIRRLVSVDFEGVRPGHFTWLSFLGSSLAFGLVHGRWLAGTLAGMAYAMAVYRRGRLADAIVAHMTTNGLIALYVIIWGEWSLWT